MSAADVTDTRPSLRAVLGDARRDFARNWVVILAAALMLGVLPTAISRWLIPWNELSGGQTLVVVELAWRVLSIALTALLSAVVITAVFQGHTAASPSVWRAAVKAFPAVFIVTLLLKAPVTLIGALLSYIPGSPQPLAQGLRLVLQGAAAAALEIVIASILGLATAAALDTRRGPRAAFGLAFRLGRGWRTRVAASLTVAYLLTVVVALLVAGGLTFGAQAADFNPNHIVIAWDAPLLWGPNMAADLAAQVFTILFLAAVYRRAASRESAVSEAFA